MSTPSQLSHITSAGKLEARALGGSLSRRRKFPACSIKVAPYKFGVFPATVNSLRKDHGAAGPEQSGPSPEEGGHHQSGQLLQSADPRPEGQSSEGPVQLWSSRCVQFTSMSEYCSCSCQFLSGPCRCGWLVTQCVIQEPLTRTWLFITGVFCKSVSFIYKSELHKWQLIAPFVDLQKHLTTS